MKITLTQDEIKQIIDKHIKEVFNLEIEWVEIDKYYWDGFCIIHTPEPRDPEPDAAMAVPGAA